MRYISADEIAEAFEADRNGISHEKIAGFLRITVAELRHVLKPHPEAGSDVEAERQL